MYHTRTVSMMERTKRGLFLIYLITCAGLYIFLTYLGESMVIFNQVSCTDSSCHAPKFKNNSFPLTDLDDECIDMKYLRQYVLEDIRKTWNSSQYDSLRDKGEINGIKTYRATCWTETVSNKYDQMIT